MAGPPTDIIGLRGARLAEVRLTRHRAFGRPLFHPAFLGDKWPAIDFYVELLSVPDARPYFFAQVKATTGPLAATHLRVTGRASDVTRMLQVPGPPYLIAVHEPSGRVFVRSVHSGIPARAITRVPVAYELTDANLLKLYDEVRRFWSAAGHKPDASEFA